MSDSYMHVYGSDMGKWLVGWSFDLWFTALSNIIFTHIGHMTSKRRRTEVDATALRRIDVSSASLRRHVPAGYLPNKGDNIMIRYARGTRQSNLNRTYYKHTWPLSLHNW